jgi:NADP-dependent 3-hydroxy acid dehydrogenase YdfG/acyl carrier protein
VRVDLDPSEQTNEVSTLFEELLFPDGEDEIALRQGARHVARLVRRQRAPRAGSLQFDGNSSYLITGGLGALGLRVAQWMVQQGSRHLVLSGRRDPSQQAREVLGHLERSGARVLVVKSDVANQHDVSQLLQSIKTSMPPLKGVIHAAGVMDEGRLVEQNWERFVRVMAPKVDGAWNLHCLTRGLPLDFFVCFSSVASLLGSPGQANYAAANAFMDALAHHRRALSLPGMGINWGPWAGEGMTARMGSRTQSGMEAIGLGKISHDLGLQLLAQLLGQNGVAQIGAFSVNWDRFIGNFQAGEAPSLFRQFANQVRQPREAEYLSPYEPKLLSKLARATETDRQLQLVAYVQQLVANALQLPPPRIDVQKLLNNMGLDSLMALELRKRLKDDLGVDLPVVKFLAGISVSDLATLLHKHLLGISSSPIPSPVDEAPRVAEGLMREPATEFSQAKADGSAWLEGEI